MNVSAEEFNRQTGPLPLPKNSKTSTKAVARSAPVQFYLPLNIAFYLCLISHVLAALYAPIQDCDETFNYWEPLHYLTHGYGLQTWEYSPEFSIRSWAYIFIHAVPTKIASLLGKSKTFEFYFVRVIFAMVCAATETRLYSAISRTLNPRIGIFYLMIIVFSPGPFYASVAFLPSSFAMYTSTLALSSFIDWHVGAKTASGLMWFGIGASLGWPFAGALSIPFILEEILVAVYGGQVFETFRRFLDGTVRCLIVLAWQICIDAFFYRKFVIVPWEIVLYNVFSGKGRGPDIFGTEAWDYYIRNLLLNFNIWFVLSVAAIPIFLLQTTLGTQAVTKQTLMRNIVFMSPLYIWIGIFTAQPHKEERFMYPAYPFLALNAAIAFHIVLIWLGTAEHSIIIGRIPAKVRLAAVVVVVFSAFNIGLFRILGTISAYRAPLQIYDGLNATRPGDTVCFGKDWYRFPTSFFLQNRVHAKFVKSEFDGLLPGEFHEGQTGFGFFPGAWLIPPGMNDRNQEDLGKHFNINHCTYLVDTYMPNIQATEHEPLYVQDSKWERILCRPFLDTAKTASLARMIWVPDVSFMPDKYHRNWGHHCLLRQKKVM